MIANLGTTMVVYFGGQNVLNHTLSAGDWFLCVQGIALLWFPVTIIASFWSQFQLGLAAAERVFALLDAEPKVVQIDNVRLPQIRGEIKFDRVDFAYNPSEPVLNDFSRTIPAGKTYALVGHTGSG